MLPKATLHVVENGVLGSRGVLLFWAVAVCVLMGNNAMVTSLRLRVGYRLVNFKRRWEHCSIVFFYFVKPACGLVCLGLGVVGLFGCWKGFIRFGVRLFRLTRDAER